MKIISNLELLKKYTQIALKCTSKNTTLPILNSIRLKVENRFLIIEATNLSLGVSCKFPVTVEEEGEVVVRSSIFESSIMNLKDKNINLSFIKGNLIIKTNSNEIIIKGEDKDDFPKLPKIESNIKINIKSEYFSEGIKSVVWSSSNSDIKPELSSVYIYHQENNMFFVATDSFRLAERKIKTRGDITDFTTLIPYKNATEISRILDVVDDDLTVSFSKNQISLETNSIYITTRVVDSVFPDYRQIIPKEKNTEIILLKKDLVEALKLAQVFSDKFNHLNLKIDKENKQCVFLSKNQDIGEQKSKIKTTITGDNTEVNINLRYVIDVMGIINEDSIAITIQNPNKPIILTGVGNKDFIYLLMPMNR